MQNMTKIEPQYFEENTLSKLFILQKNFLLRRKIHFCIGILAYSEDLSMDYQTFFSSIQKMIRHSDFAFESRDQSDVLILLSLSKENEVHYLLKRVERNLMLNDGELISCIAEIATARVELEEIITELKSSLKEMREDNRSHYFIQKYKIPDSEEIKVSIIENDEITLTILNNIISNMYIDKVDLQIQLFKDGISFIESDWYKSAHRHIVLINDILPKMNGLEVLEYLRQEPNNQKFYIYIISNRLSEDAALNAYNKGANQYITRPFNLNVLDMQLKNYIKGLV